MDQDSLPSREQLLERLRAYHAYISTSAPNEEQADQMLFDLDLMVPHAAITDLIFWGERERTDDEVVDEALHREQLWRTEGDLALLLHIRAQMEAGMNDPSARHVHRNYAERTFRQVSADIERSRSGRVH